MGRGFYEGKDGAGDEIRTRDINLGKVALYQLSYSRLGKQTGQFPYYSMGTAGERTTLVPQALRTK